VEEVELRRRVSIYRTDRTALDVAGRVVILVDDGLATGATMRAAATAVRRQRPARLIVAVPVGLSGGCAEMNHLVDDIICTWMPQEFYAVGQAYETFDQTTDEEVQRILRAAQHD
jgi:putative phosphoribosyl transferase